MKAIQDELGEGDEQQAELAELRERIEEAGPPRGGGEAGRARAGPAREPAAGRRRVRRHPHLPRVADRAPLVEGDRGQPRHQARARRSSTRTTTTSRRSRTGSSSTSRSASSTPTRPGRSSASSGRPASARRASASRSRAPSGREFERISVGGVRDEAEIRGHRRTYIGAMPGTIIRALRDAGTRNPVFMIDEIDKMGADFRGDPSSAMLEVLDPAQNSSFRDHYLDLPVRPLRRDVHRDGEHPRHDPRAAPGPDGDDPARRLHQRREAPHRQEVPRPAPARGERAQALAGRARRRGADGGHRGVHARGRRPQPRARDRHRAAARSPARSPRARSTARSSVSGKRARELLGKRKFFAEQRRRTKDPGVATGLAWTPVGGEVLFVEASAVPGDGKLTITGQLGDVMRESAQAALTYVRGHAKQLAPDLADDWFASHDIHIHVPAGAVPKDGPSAGIAMATALASLVSGRPVRNDVAMTGEITLTGQVLPIGGLKEKALAAQRAGIKKVIVPDRNEGDVEEIPKHEREGPRVPLRRRDRRGARGSPSSGRRLARKPARRRAMRLGCVNEVLRKGADRCGGARMPRAGRRPGQAWRCPDRRRQWRLGRASSGPTTRPRARSPCSPREPRSPTPRTWPSARTGSCIVADISRRAFIASTRPPAPSRRSSRVRRCRARRGAGLWP